jgi:hypothetical protein
MWLYTVKGQDNQHTQKMVILKLSLKGRHHHKLKLLN